MPSSESDAFLAFGNALREHRLGANISLAELSRRVHYSKSYLSKVENGLKLPSVDLARRCDAQLEAHGRLSSLIERSEPATSPSSAAVADVWTISLGPDGSSEFRGLQRKGQGVTGAASSFSWNLHLSTAPNGTEGSTLSSFLTLFRESRKLGQTVAPATLIPMLITQTNALRVLSTKGSHAERAHSLMLAARFAEFTGWMAQESGNDEAAIWWTDHSCDLAEAAGSPDFAAYALVRQALVTMYLHDSRSTIQLAQLAQEQTSNARILGLAAQREAQGHALAGDYDSCLRALDRAARHLGQSVTDDEPVLGTSTIQNPVSLATAWCLHDLGRPKEAIIVFQNELPKIPADAHRAIARYTARFALSLAAAGEIEQAALAVEPVIKIMSRVDSATIRSDLRRLAQELNRSFRQPTVQALVPRLAAVLQVPVNR
jgi:transcriptional regulator with XRE-family HTH domain